MRKKCSSGPRDNNVKGLYHVENNELPVGQKFADWSGAQDYVNFVTATAFWQLQSGLPRWVQVFSLGDLKYSEAQMPNELWLSQDQLNQQVVLHELSHFFRQGKPDHGPAYINFYLCMVSNFMGVWYETLYRDAFRREGIKF